MRSPKRAGQIIGQLILVQLACGLLVSFVLLGSLTAPQGFLESMAGSSVQVSLAVLLWLVTGSLSIAIAITARSFFSQFSPTMALWYLVLSVITFSLFAVENVAVMSMLTLSQKYTATVPEDGGYIEALGQVVRTAYIWAGNISALVAEVTILVLYCILYRYLLVPRALSAFGLVAVSLKITAITMLFFGLPFILLMVLPMVLAYITLAIWLTIKGFDERPERS